MDEQSSINIPNSKNKNKKRKKLKLLKAKAVLNDSSDKKEKKSKQNKKKILGDKHKKQKEQDSGDDSDFETYDFSDAEEEDDMELKNDIDKFIKNLNFERFSNTFNDSNDEEDSCIKSPKKKKLKSVDKSQCESENQDENPNPKKSVENHDDKNSKETKKSKKLKKKKQIEDNEEKMESDSRNPKKSVESHDDKNSNESKKSKKLKKKKQIEENEEKMELDSKSVKLEQGQDTKNKNKKTSLKSDIDFNNFSKSNVNPTYGDQGGEGTQKTTKEKTLPKASSAAKSENEGKKNEILDKLKKQLQSASFRLINEQLYTTTGKDAYEMFKEDPNSFKVYHEGYSKQVSEWPVNPVDLIISWLRKKPRTWTVADFGCGNAILSRSVKQKVFSIDLISSAPNVIKCNMANTPLESNSVNVVVFCLSLMGTNLTEFIVEANRVLVDRGTLKIAEIESRFEKNVKQFLKVMLLLGFQNCQKNQNQNYFWLFEFIKVKSVKMNSKLPELKLKACVYKKR